MGESQQNEHGMNQKSSEDQWDGAAFLSRAGVRETAKISFESIVHALLSTEFSKEEIMKLHVLEVGSGPGAVTSLLLPQVASIHCIDTSPSMLLALSSNHPTTENLSWSLHSLNPNSASEFQTPLYSPIKEDQERKFPPPRLIFDVAIANLVLHHVDDIPPFFAGLRGLLRHGGLFILTEFGMVDGRDVAGEARKQMAEERARTGQTHKHHHHIHPSFSVESITALLEKEGFIDIHAEIRGVLPLWPGKPEPPCLVAWGRKS